MLAMHRHTSRRLLLVAVCMLALPVWAAEPPPSNAQPLQILQKIQDAARTLDYSGVYTYQQGTAMVSSRVVHIVDGTGERERLELLDGAPREFLRHNEVTQCLVPEKKQVLVERRRGDRFPALILGSGANISEHYQVNVLPVPHRIASRECSMIELLPNDAHRYGYRLCADNETNLLLKVQTISAEHGLIDQISFNSLQLGDKVRPEQLVSEWNTKNWKVVETAMEPVDLAADGWRIPFPPGFQSVTQVSRPMKRGRKVSQLVVTDGLAAISVFIEPYDPNRPEPSAGGMARAGAMNIFQARIGDYRLTALGEVPAGTLRSIAQSTEYVPRSDH
ncbi:MucB/RseB C-terminal domain-containing protein [Pollutimonas harenae]|uniref:MucB/RseB C-terminal domain-containing protein n=1 Tax=Pollutimonas harenae TaxID=657015 RepID=A0A853GR39_9BURK|nr:MucB/RseB C-terminal domain-containing protein [Pollutimonas harenae]NYT85538.1 MucB/RseB C-terminal domain-containing protein [Pollutimonas harenae]TEA70625.1 siderophore-interacting protein [Pollutimonas harenae]